MGPICSKPEDKKQIEIAQNNDKMKAIRNSKRLDLPDAGDLNDLNDTHARIYEQQEVEQWIQFEDQGLKYEDAEATARIWCAEKSKSGLGTYTYVEHNMKPSHESQPFEGEPSKFKIRFKAAPPKLDESIAEDPNVALTKSERFKAFKVEAQPQDFAVVQEPAEVVQNIKQLIIETAEEDDEYAPE